MTRVYLPVTVAELTELRSTGALAAPEAGRAGHAVTAAVREWYVSGDLEELEYSALVDAAETSLRLIADRPGTSPRRAVVAADVADRVVVPVGDRTRSSVLVAGAITLAEVASIHLDEPEAAAAVTAAIEALPLADAGDDDAQFLLDEASACDLLWYDVSELEQLG